MSKMARKQIYIEPEQEYLLKARAADLHISESELIREGINRVLEKNKVLLRDVNAWEEEKKFILSLGKKGYVKGGRRWKREDIYDREISGRH